MSLTESAFIEPPWDTELDVPRVLAAIPTTATIAGMFFLGVYQGAQRRNVTLSAARDRYLPFGFYPVTEFAPLLLAAAKAFHPDLSLRQALRAIGTVGPAVLAQSVLGKVTLGSAIGVHAVIEAIARTYSVNIRPSRCSVAQQDAKSCVVSLDDVPYFLDSHHVGVFEGTLMHAGVSGRVRIASRSAESADLLLEW